MVDLVRRLDRVGIGRTGRSNGRAGGSLGGGIVNRARRCLGAPGGFAQDGRARTTLGKGDSRGDRLARPGIARHRRLEDRQRARGAQDRPAGNMAQVVFGQERWWGFVGHGVLMVNRPNAYHAVAT